MNKFKGVLAALCLIGMIILNSSYTYNTSQKLKKAENMQSPINVDEKIAKKENPQEKKIINYAPDTYMGIIDNDRLNIYPENKKNNVIFGGKTYILDSFHFHSPSEHQLNGETFDMELHFINLDSEGNRIALSMFMKEGAKNTELAKIWEKLPEDSKDDAIAYYGELDLKNFFPADKTKYMYIGSLTIPPYTEGVKWYIYKEPIEMSGYQIYEYRSVFGENHRPVQPLRGRGIYKDSGKEDTYNFQ